jgi:hypothetical protein
VPDDDHHCTARLRADISTSAHIPDVLPQISDYIGLLGAVRVIVRILDGGN